MNRHVVLLGDSIFDNGAYTEGGPDVITQIRAMLPAAWRASLRAVDGSTIADLHGQSASLPADTTHLVISIGGNDVLANLDVLALRVRSSSEALLKIGQRVREFERGYREAIRPVLTLGKQTTVCTIYNGNLESADVVEASLLPDPAVARIGLMAFNDVILRVAFENGLDVIDLRLVCTEPADYANPIEPSSRGGEKIARAILHALGVAGDSARPSSVYWT